MVATVFTFGIKVCSPSQFSYLTIEVPAGLFVPNLAVGAIMGRIIGLLMDHLVRYDPPVHKLHMPLATLLVLSCRVNQYTHAMQIACPDIETCVTPGSLPLFLVCLSLSCHHWFRYFFWKIVLHLFVADSQDCMRWLEQLLR